MSGLAEMSWLKVGSEKELKIKSEGGSKLLSLTADPQTSAQTSSRRASVQHLLAFASLRLPHESASRRAFASIHPHHHRRPPATMADDNPDNILSATFPAPPPFWKHFTPENRARLKELQDTAKGSSNHDDEGSNSAQQPPRLADLPPELRYLQPPEPPANGKYRSFGDQYDVRFSPPFSPYIRTCVSFAG